MEASCFLQISRKLAKHCEVLRIMRDQSDLDKSEADLIKARDELREAIASAKKERDDTVPARSGTNQRANVIDNLVAQLGNVGKNLQSQLRLSVSGSFQGSALSGLGTGAVTDRTAKATEETAKNTKKLLDRLGTGQRFT